MMKTLAEQEMDQIAGGGDSLAKDLGQFVGGTAGWVRAHPLAYTILGPGVGLIVAAVAGLNEAAR